MNGSTNSNVREKIFNWSILLLISLAPIVTGSYRDGFAALFPFLQKEFSLTRAQLGLHSTFFFFTSAMVAIFTGRLVDLKGTKWGLVAGVSFAGIFVILHSIIPNYFGLLLIASFTGLAVSIINPASNKGIVEWFPLRWRSTALGILSAGFPVGGMLGAIFLPLLGVSFGWRKAILFPGGLALLCGLLVLHFYQDKINSKENKRKNVKNDILFWKNFKQLIKNNDLLSISFLGFFLGALNGSIATHFALFLYLDYGFMESIAGLGFAFVQLGSILGRPGWGFICDKFIGSNKRLTFLYIGFIFTFLSLILGLYLREFNFSLNLLFILAFFVGCAGRGWNGLYFSTVVETVKEEHIGIAVGFSMLFIRSGIMLTPPIFGYIADIRGAYDYSWLFLGLMMFLASTGQYLYYLKVQKKKNKKIVK